MKKNLAFLILVLLFSNFASAKVFINEIEINPAGSDFGNQWIEIYNSNVIPVNVTNWKLVDNTGINNTFVDETIINATGLLTINSTHTITNTNQIFTLLNETNGTIDSTIINDDTADNNKTWSRVPDGSDMWQFQEETKDIHNTDLLAPEIVTQSRNLDPVFEDDNLALSTIINENYLKKVSISGNWTGTWSNFTVFSSSANVTQNNFTYIVTKNNLESGESVGWYFIAEDNNGNIGSGEEQNFTIRTSTLVNVTPSTPNGLNGWYVTAPLFSIIKDSEAVSSYYRFDSLVLNQFIGPFLFDVNSTSGGTERLDFFSNFGNRNESVQNITIKVDVSSPKLKYMIPEGIVKSKNVDINTLIDDVFFGNSGLDMTSLIFKLDDNIVIPTNISLIDSLKATVNYSAVNLPEGTHNVSITIADNANNTGSYNWSFFVNSTNQVLNVTSPLNGNYGTNRLRFDIKTNIAGKITFVDNDQRESILCTNCLSFNRSLSFRDGYHNLTIKLGSEEVNRTVFLDSTKPNIIRVLPRSNGFVSIANFSIQYTEDFLDSIKVYYGTNKSNLDNSALLTNCSSGRNKFCDTLVNLSSFDSQKVFFIFNVSDKIRNVSSRESDVFVDVTSPKITINQYLNNSVISRAKGVRIDLNLSEKVKDLDYQDLNSFKPSFRRLCSDCTSFNRTIFFASGLHSIELKAEDKAKNFEVKFMNFTVI